MDQAQIQQALAAQQNPQKAQEDMKKQQEIQEKRNVMLQSLMTSGAKERCILNK
ncbi:MAG: hypothetical protein MJ252_04600 [archaeon]|nr:hypothetical protein [archaeon]